jgi:two-component system, cell cycle sensor histidine kinase PleC
MSLAYQPTHANRDDALTPTLLDALHSLRVAITLFDAEERLVFANEHLGYMFRNLPPSEELIGRAFEEIVRLEISEGDIADPNGKAADFVKGHRARLLEGDYSPRDLAFSDGRIVEVKTRRTRDGGWISLWTDVTQARQTLMQLHAAIELSADAFAFFDRRDRLTLCNAEYAAINGHKSPNDIVGDNFEEVIGRISRHAIAEEQAAQWLKMRREIHRQPAGAMTVELKSGTAYMVRDRASSDGGRIAVLTDVTDHHRVEKALAEQTRALDDTHRALADTKAKSEAQASYLADLAIKLDQTAASADNTKTTLLRTMSHELKTPLNAIIGFSDLLGSLADIATPDQIREYSGLIHMGGNNLLKLILAILELTKISAGRYVLRLQNIDADHALWESKQNLEDRAADKNIEIVAEPVQPVVAVRADETALTTMLGHLVDNAVSFTQPGGRVILSAFRYGSAVRFTVADNGPGVAEADMQRILEPFEQGGRSTTDHEAGGGLGLTLVKSFAELHGGKLTIESTQGEGFTAILELPAAD